jgi:DNA-binding transcriptional regulator GbsR (MarR family)
MRGNAALPMPSTSSTSISLEPWEEEVLDLFVGVFETLGLPKSTARIYGWLYCSDDGRTQEELCQGLEMSAGSASGGLKLLLRLGAVRKHAVDGQRHSHYTAERSMRQLLAHFLDVEVRPGLQQGRDRLEALKADLPDDSARHKIDTLLTWQNKAEKLLPLAATVFGLSKK